jgi:hypothetical protein
MFLYVAEPPRIASHKYPELGKYAMHTVHDNNKRSAFTVSNGQIIAPNGHPFIAKGINVADWAITGYAGSSNNGALILALFPHINFVRLNCQTLATATPDALRTFITTLTNAKVVVVIEDHSPVTGGPVNLLSDAAQKVELAWYAAHVNAFGHNPYVWFGTMNEPFGPGAEVTAQQVSIYKTIRVGSANPILLQQIGGFSNTINGGLVAASYASMVNVVWDSHFYGWVSQYSTDLANISAVLVAQIANAQSIRSATGLVPVIIGEYGISTVGVVPDANGTQTVKIVQGSGHGAAAWTWSGNTSDWLVNGGTLTLYGREVAAFIAGLPTSGFSTLGP